jgi:hypothetical protein
MHEQVPLPHTGVNRATRALSGDTRDHGGFVKEVCGKFGIAWGRPAGPCGLARRM